MGKIKLALKVAKIERKLRKMGTEVDQINQEIANDKADFQRFVQDVGVKISQLQGTSDLSTIHAGLADLKTTIDQADANLNPPPADTPPA